MQTDGDLRFIERQFRAGVITRYEYEYLRRIRTVDPRVKQEERRDADERATDNLEELLWQLKK